MIFEMAGVHSYTHTHALENSIIHTYTQTHKYIYLHACTSTCTYIYPCHYVKRFGVVAAIVADRLVEQRVAAAAVDLSKRKHVLISKIVIPMKPITISQAARQPVSQSASEPCIQLPLPPTQHGNLSLPSSLGKL